MIKDFLFRSLIMHNIHAVIILYIVSKTVRTIKIKYSIKLMDI